MMKMTHILPVVIALFALQACSAGKGTLDPDESTRIFAEDSREKNEVINRDGGEFRELSDYLERIPGVEIRGQGSNKSVIIRGEGTFIAGTEPLYVVDGVIVGNSYSSVSHLGSGDIANVRVLKGADASIYGSRGSNGVIRITTRSGRQ